MAESVACPDCQARLDLPALPKGQTVQCPRCAHVFEPALTRAAPKRLPRTLDVSDAAAPIESARFTHAEPLHGGWKAPAAMIALAACLLSYLLQLYVNYERFELLQREIANPFFGVRNDPWFEWEALADDARILHHLTFWPAAVLFLIWLHQASSNAWRLQAKGLYFSPAAALSFFVPLLNLVWPYYMLQEIWCASHPRAIGDPLAWKNVPGALAIRLWWACCLAAVALWVFNHLLMFEHRFNHDEERVQAIFACFANACVIATTALMIFIIRGIQLRQTERHARLSEQAE